MKIIALDAGHGLNTAGKEITLNGYARTKEWYLNDRISDRVEELLADYECKVIRVGDTTGKKDISLAERVKTANNVGATVYISVHHDSGVKGGLGGGTTVHDLTSWADACKTYTSKTACDSAQFYYKNAVGALEWVYSACEFDAAGMTCIPSKVLIKSYGVK